MKYIVKKIANTFSRFTLLGALNRMVLSFILHRFNRFWQHGFRWKPSCKEKNSSFCV